MFLSMNFGSLGSCGIRFRGKACYNDNHLTYIIRATCNGADLPKKLFSPYIRSIQASSGLNFQRAPVDLHSRFYRLWDLRFKKCCGVPPGRWWWRQRS